jgi:hypothetical protein
MLWAMTASKSGFVSFLAMLFASSLAALAQNAPSSQPATGGLAAAKPITLHIKDLPPKDAIAKLGEAAGVNISVWPDTAWDSRFRGNKAVPKVTIDAEAQPFWAVARDLCQQADAKPADMGTPDQLTIMESENFFDSPVYMGPAHLAIVTGIRRSYQTTFSGPARKSEHMSVELDLWFDPRLQFLQSAHTVTVTEALDENGVSIVVPADKAMDRFSRALQRLHMNTSVRLNYDPAKSKTLKKFSGYLRLIMESKREEIRIADLANAEGIEAMAAGVRLVITEVIPQNKSLQIKYTITPQVEISDERWTEISQSAFSRMIVTNETGRRISLDKNSRGSRKKIDGTLTLNTSDNSKLNLVWPIATETEQVDLPFEFNDLPLP